MTWVRIDDHFDQHPKLAKAGPLGVALWVTGLAYCNRNLTDGFIPWSTAQALLSWEFLGDAGERGRKRYQVAVTCGMSGDDVNADFVIRLLTDAGLWDEVDGGYHVHDYGDYQPSKEEVLEERAKTRERVAKFRNSHSNGGGNGVTNAGVTLPPVPVPVPVPDPLTPSGPIGPSGVRARARREPIRKMTDLEFSDLVRRFGEATVTGKLEYGRNLQGWETKFKSEYATIKRWCEADARQDDKAITLTQSDSEERRRKFAGGSLGAFVQTGEELAQ